MVTRPNSPSRPTTNRGGRLYLGSGHVMKHCNNLMLLKGLKNSGRTLSNWTHQSLWNVLLLVNVMEGVDNLDHRFHINDIIYPILWSIKLMLETWAKTMIMSPMRGWYEAERLSRLKRSAAPTSNTPELITPTPAHCSHSSLLLRTNLEARPTNVITEPAHQQQ